MSFPNRDNPYNFDAFIGWRNNVDYYADDPFLQKLVRHFAGDDWPNVDTAARILSRQASFRWRDLADRAARPENSPYLLQYDGHNHRIDRIVRPLETVLMEEEVFAEALFSRKTSPWERLVKMFLIYQNGEACIACPLTCTEGLVAILEAFADTDETKQILAHCREGIDGDFAIGAQYLSEIQGGSDVPANLLEAVQEGTTWRLYGTKFFCSATHADYALVTAKPRGSQSIATFVVPAWLPGNKAREIRNGHTIDRLKWKMGTTELTTGEMTFRGAVAYPIGPLDRGMAHVVGIVLTYSRLTVGLSAAASMTRAAREALRYAEFRSAFGRPIHQFPMVAGQLADLEHSAKRSTAGAFKLYSQFLQLDGKNKLSINPEERPPVQQQRFNARELVMLQKITASRDAVDQLRLAMSIFGGHGVMEDFSSLPRLYRDGVVNELWEGPRNVLLDQIHRDLHRAKPWYEPAEFVHNLLAGADTALVTDLAAEVEKIATLPSLTEENPAMRTACREWDNLCHRLFHAYQDLALAEVNQVEF
ncbi:acyl-CoA dehydrogenase family protein [Desulfosediminicola ganghwensis]|uniref:acyl-CoA dehydrogenase family protein n=1 Tax=Desulfosediminicola ganghwensis TaxID=2569540 RepID=UPI0010ACFEC3|nr:acyl-CoA dehydrogenase family protein [Desulfosediminicola ganghwensis]